MAGDKERWHLHKGVPVAIIATLIMQMAGWIWSASSMNSQIAQTVTDVAENKADIKAGSSTEPRLVRVETDIGYIRRGVDDNRSKLDGLNDKITELIRATLANPR